MIEIRKEELINLKPGDVFALNVNDPYLRQVEGTPEEDWDNGDVIIPITDVKTTFVAGEFYVTVKEDSLRAGQYRQGTEVYLFRQAASKSAADKQRGRIRSDS